MDSIREPSTAPSADDSKPNPLEVELHVTTEAAEKLREALANAETETQWVRIYPQGIS